jgi:hypothetical protein
VVGGWWVVVYKPILLFSFDFGQAEQKSPHGGKGRAQQLFSN